jgi:hypothetical protein
MSTNVFESENIFANCTVFNTSPSQYIEESQEGAADPSKINRTKTNPYRIFITNIV